MLCVSNYSPTHIIMLYNYPLRIRELWPVLIVSFVIIISLVLGGYVPSAISSSADSDFFLKLLSILVGAIIFVLIFLGHLQRALRLSLYIAIFLVSQTGMLYFFQIRETIIMTSALEIHLLAVFLLLLIKNAINRQREKTFLDLPIKCFLFAGFLGILSGFMYEVKPENIFMMVKPFYLYMVLFYLLVNVIKDEKSLKNCINIFLICNLYPFYIAITETIKHLSGINVIARLSPEWAPINVFAAYLMVMFFVLLSLFLFEKSSKKWIFLPFLLISLIAILFMQTRGVWIGFAVAFFFFCFFRNKKRGILIGIVSAIMILGVVKTSKMDVGGIFKIATEGRMNTVETRKKRATYAIAMLKEHPVLGMGWGAYYVPSKKGELRQVPDLLPRWHNDYLIVASGTGIFGLIVFLWIWCRLIRKSYFEIQRKRRDGATYLWSLQTGLLSGIIGFLITASAGQYFYRLETAAYVWFFVGILVVSLKLSKLKDRKEGERFSA